METLKSRLIATHNKEAVQPDLIEQLINRDELPDELLDELLDSEADPVNGQAASAQAAIALDVAPEKLQAEIEELDSYVRWANSIGTDSKSRSPVSYTHLTLPTNREV